jgi:hypothetical protein
MEFHHWVHLFKTCSIDLEGQKDPKVLKHPFLCGSNLPWGSENAMGIGMGKLPQDLHF